MKLIERQKTRRATRETHACITLHWHSLTWIQHANSPRSYAAREFLKKNMQRTNNQGAFDMCGLSCSNVFVYYIEFALMHG